MTHGRRPRIQKMKCLAQKLTEWRRIEKLWQKREIERFSKIGRFALCKSCNKVALISPGMVRFCRNWSIHAPLSWSVCMEKYFLKRFREFQRKSEDQRGQLYWVSGRNIVKQAEDELCQSQDNLHCAQDQNTKFQIIVCIKYSCEQWKTISIWL